MAQHFAYAKLALRRHIGGDPLRFSSHKILVVADSDGSVERTGHFAKLETFDHVAFLDV
jgi:hypothetical protein